MEVTPEPELTLVEEKFQAMWRSYFSTLAIVERKNLRLQQSKVPRPWLVEFDQFLTTACGI
jgi:hypothetical protein